MRTPRHPWGMLLLFTVLLAGCAGATRPGGGSGTNRNMIDITEIDPALHPNAYSVVQALRPHWLEVRGQGTRMVKRAYLGNMYLGQADALRSISSQTIASIQYFDGPAATQRWGPDHAGGVIQVSTRSM